MPLQQVQDKMEDAQDKIQRVQNIDLKGNVEQGIMDTMNKGIDEAHKEADKKVKTATTAIERKKHEAEKNSKIEAHVQKAKNDLHNHLQKKKGRAGGGNLIRNIRVNKGKKKRRKTMKKLTKKGKKTPSKKRTLKKRKTKKRKQRKNKRHRSIRRR